MATINNAKFFTAAVAVTATAGGASGNVIYTCPNNFISLVKFLHVSNGSSNNYKYSIQWYEASTTTYYYVVDEHSLAANSLKEVVQGGAYLALAAGDKLVCFQEMCAEFHILLSGEEHYQPT